MAAGTGSADRITGVGTGLEATLITRNSLGVGVLVFQRYLAQPASKTTEGASMDIISRA